MGISVELRSEDGSILASVIDEKNVLHSVLPAPADRMFPYLSTVDWYGDTVFNKLQAPQLLQELKTVRDRAKDAPSARLIDAVCELAQRLQEGTHIYLVFVGD